MTCCCNDSSVSLACVAQCSSGFDHTGQAGHYVLCTAICCRSLSTLRLYAICYSICYMLGSARLSPWSAVLHAVHGGPYGSQVRRVSSRLCGRHLHFRHDEMASSADQLECCILDIGQWMSANRLKLNAGKTELLLLLRSTESQLSFAEISC